MPGGGKTAWAWSAGGRAEVLAARADAPEARDAGFAPMSLTSEMAGIWLSGASRWFEANRYSRFFTPPLATFRMTRLR